MTLNSLGNGEETKAEHVSNLRLRRRVQPCVDLGPMLAIFEVDLEVLKRFFRAWGIVLEGVAERQQTPEGRTRRENNAPFPDSLST